MEIIEKISELKTKDCVLTIGNFDGVHIGHQKILAAAKNIAEEKSTELVVMTFEPHPVAILHPEKAPGVLTLLGLKQNLLARFRVDFLIVLRDCIELLNLSPADFVDRFLIKDLQPSIVVEGENFNFGAGRAGNIHTLNSLGQERGFGVMVIDAEEVRLSIGRSVRVSSTLIRNLLEVGKVADAAVALGRTYRLVGKVIPGRGKGKKLGFPTLNMERPGQIIPVEGVYAGRAALAESKEQVCSAQAKEPAALSIGKSSTYGADNPLLIEAHLLREDVGGLYGKWIAMDFVEFIRHQQKFDTEKELSAQIAKDCERARIILTEVPGTPP